MDKHRITKVLFQDTAMDDSTGATRLADEHSPPEPEDSAADSEPTPDDSLQENKGNHSEVPAPAAGPMEVKPGPGPDSVSAKEELEAGGERKPGELEKPLG